MLTSVDPVPKLPKSVLPASLHAFLLTLSSILSQSMSPDMLTNNLSPKVTTLDRTPWPTHAHLLVVPNF